MIRAGVFFGGLVVAVGLAVAAAAQQQAQCGPRASVIGTLAEKYGESQRLIGVSADDLVMEVYASDVSRTWTITVTTPQGITCLVVVGRGFEVVAAPPPGVPG